MSAIFLVISFIFICVLLSAAIIFSRLHWILKAALISFTLAFGALFHFGLTGLLGYPVRDSVPELFRFISSAVREPTTGDPGAIFIWYLDTSNNLPRAIVIPYSKTMRDKMTEAKKRSQQGAVFMGRGTAGGRGAHGTGQSHGDGQSSGSNHPGNGAQIGQGRGPGGSSFGSGGNGDDPVDFKLPPETVPSKD